MKKKLHLYYVSFLFLAITTLLVFSSFNLITPLWSSGQNIYKKVRAGNTASHFKNNEASLIIVSGRDENDLILKTVQRYNVNTNSWDTLAPHPTGLLGGATSVLKDSLYVVGGVVNPPGSGQQTVYKLSINENIWSTVADFPISIVDAKAVSYQDSLIYTAGGFSGINEGIVFLYNSNTNSWRQCNSMPCTGRLNFGGFAIAGDTLIYMCGTSSFGSSSYFDSVYVGVIDQNDRSVINWSLGTNFPGETRTFFDACSWGNRGIIMTGGSTDNTFNTASNECYTYSPGSRQWTALPDKPTSWLTGQSGSVMLENNIWKLICASGYNNGYLSQTEILSDTLSTVGIIGFNSAIPGSSALYQNYPNPFNPNTNISFKLNSNEIVTLKIYDLNGKEVQTLLNEKLNAGTYDYDWNASGFSSGVYYYKLTAGSFSETKKLMLIK